MENPRVWFRSISLENVRSFGRKQTIYFTEDGTENGPVARWNVLLGDNGTGKTTVLRTLTCAANYKLGDRMSKFYNELSRFDTVSPNIYYSVVETAEGKSVYHGNHNLVITSRQKHEEFEIPPRAPEAEQKMIRRRALLLRDNLSAAEKQELNQLDKELGILPVSESWEAVKAMDIIKRAMLNQE